MSDDMTLLGTDTLLERMIDLADARDSDPEAAAKLAQHFAAFHYALTHGAPIPARWSGPPAGTPVDIEVDTDGALRVTTLSDPDLIATFEEDDQIGFYFDAQPSDLDREPESVWFPVPRAAVRAKPRKNSPATVDLPLDGPSLFASAAPIVGLHSPDTSHQAIKHTSRAWTRARVEELFWMVYDAGAQGLCTFEALARVERHEVGVHHGAVSGRINWLMNHGFIEDSGIRRKTKKNRNAKAWVPTQRVLERIALGLEKRPYPLPAVAVDEVADTAALSAAGALPVEASRVPMVPEVPAALPGIAATVSVPADGGGHHDPHPHHPAAA